MDVIPPPWTGEHFHTVTSYMARTSNIFKFCPGLFDTPANLYPLCIDLLVHDRLHFENVYILSKMASPRDGGIGLLKSTLKRQHRPDKLKPANPSRQSPVEQPTHEGFLL